MCERWQGVVKGKQRLNCRLQRINEVLYDRNAKMRIDEPNREKWIVLVNDMKKNNLTLIIICTRLGRLPSFCSIRRVSESNLQVYMTLSTACAAAKSSWPLQGISSCKIEARRNKSAPLLINSKARCPSTRSMCPSRPNRAPSCCIN